jgi:hypothetical protein
MADGRTHSSNTWPNGSRFWHEMRGWLSSIRIIHPEPDRAVVKMTKSLTRKSGGATVVAEGNKSWLSPEEPAPRASHHKHRVHSVTRKLPHGGDRMTRMATPHSCRCLSPRFVTAYTRFFLGRVDGVFIPTLVGAQFVAGDWRTDVRTTGSHHTAAMKYPPCCNTS